MRKQFLPVLRRRVDRQHDGSGGQRAEGLSRNTPPPAVARRDVDRKPVEVGEAYCVSISLAAVSNRCGRLQGVVSVARSVAAQRLREDRNERSVACSSETLFSRSIEDIELPEREPAVVGQLERPGIRRRGESGVQHRAAGLVAGAQRDAAEAASARTERRRGHEVVEAVAGARLYEPRRGCLP